MLLLAIDTATPAVTAGVVRLDRERASTLAERVTLGSRAHGELSTPHVLDAVAAAGVTLRDIDAIVCGNGPGPYTGLRAGMATAGALGHGLGAPVYPVCSLDAIAAEVVSEEPFLVITDARRREVYWAEYPGGPPSSERTLSRKSALSGPHVHRPAELRTDCRVGAGQGAALYAQTLNLRMIDPAHPSPRGLALAVGAEVLAGCEPAPLTPLYLRQPHAAEPGARKRVSAP